jgi:hypothetical protein
MKLLDQHIEFIETNLKFYGIKSDALKEDLVDHICSYIERQDSEDFNLLYQEALQKFGGYGSFQNLQLETNFQKYSQHLIFFNKVQIIVGSLAVLLFVFSLLFKTMHWPYANLLMILGCVIAALFLIPIYFYNRYKKSVHKFS